MTELARKVLIIAGPTASGKSSLAIDAAKIFNGVVVNCDALQVYKDIPVIAATPTADDKRQVEHRLYEIYDCSKRGNVVDWLDLCVKEIREIWKTNRLPIVVGGTGMYIDALLHGVTPIPEIAANCRTKVEEKLAKYGLAELYDYLQQIDPLTAQRLHPNDKTRIVRAVEIFLATGQKLSEWFQKPLVQKLPEAKFTVAKIMPSQAELEARCRERLDIMVYQLGALAEIEKLLKRNLPADLPAMKALGVPELSRFLRQECSLDEALAAAKLHTRQYAKRQRTWLRNKLVADVTFEQPYQGQKDYLQQIKIALNG